MPRCFALAFLVLAALPAAGGASAQTPAQPAASPSASPSPAAASTPQPVAASKTEVPKAVRAWRDAVMARLVKFKPAGAGATGIAVVAFTLGADGQVLSTTLAHASGHAKLDEAAVAMVKRASPLPAPPAELSAPVSLTVPIRYR